MPKPLIPVDGRPLVSHWLELLLEAGLQRDDVYIVTNQHFYPAFSQWAADNKVAQPASFRQTQRQPQQRPHATIREPLSLPQTVVLPVG